MQVEQIIMHLNEFIFLFLPMSDKNMMMQSYDQARNVGQQVTEPAGKGVRLR